MTERQEIGLTIKKEQDFSEWYTQLLQKAELIEYSGVSGCYILRPQAYAIWEKIKHYLDTRFKAVGVKNAYFPLLIPEHLLTKESEHIKGFSPEVAWVTQTGETKLKERLAIRPTSETIMYESYSKWIRSYKDLPLRLNQWCNIIRWEFKHPVPFLRSREFLWQEGHTAFATQQEALKEAYQILDIYEDCYKELLAVPTLKGKKSDKEKFAGADLSLSLEIFLPNKKAIQGCTSHHLGQNFSTAFDIKYIDKDKKKKYVHQNSWGFSTRTMGILIAIHSDNKGLVLPPLLAEHKIVIVPILFEERKKELLKQGKQLKKTLKAFNPVVDEREDYRPGWKYNEWELKGIPLRLELGPKDIEKKQVVLVRRDTGKKERVKIKDVKKKVEVLLKKIQKDLYTKANKFLHDNIENVKTWEQAQQALKNKKIIFGSWCKDENCETTIKDKTNGVKSLNISLDSKQKGKRCFHCQAVAKEEAYFSRSY